MLRQPELQKVRDAYEVLVERQRKRWHAAGSETWEKGSQPRLNLRPYGEADPILIDEEVAAAVEVWAHPNVAGASSKLLGVADAGVTEMLLMCSPQADHGPLACEAARHSYLFLHLLWE